MDKKKRIGHYINSSVFGGEKYQSYIPQPLPPEPPVNMAELYPLLDQATAALGRLDGISRLLPDTSLFLYMYIRKEAVLSAQIEGTQSSLSDLLLFENEGIPGVPMDEVREVSCYVMAMDYGLRRVQELPLSLRLLKEIHARLLNKARGSNKQPGEFRSSQNWIGGSRPGNARFVPPPPEYLMDCLDKFEKFLHDDKNVLPILVKAALAHVQFETIHPFLDGNGRLGRLLITFILCVEGLLTQPLLYLSLYFKANREAYYNHLQSVRETGDWEAWIKFFLTGIIETAQQATETARSILALFTKDNETIKSQKLAATALVLHSYLQKHPIVTTARLQKAMPYSLPTLLRRLKELEKLDIVRETTGKPRHKTFIYKKYLDLLNEGTEPLPR